MTQVNIIWTENGDVIDRFLPEILTFKASQTHMLDTLCSTLFERQYLWWEAMNQIFFFIPNNVILRGIRYAKKIDDLSFKELNFNLFLIYSRFFIYPPSTDKTNYFLFNSLSV